MTRVLLSLLCALPHAEEDCAHGLSSSCLMRGLELAHAPEVDDRRAVGFFERGCVLDSDEACWELARRYAWGLGVNQDVPRAGEIHGALCAAGLQKSCEAVKTLEASQHALDDARIGEIIALHFDEAAFCSVRGKFVGWLTIEGTIDSRGSVASISQTDDSRAHPQAAECIGALLMHWKFPPPKGGKPAHVSFPLELRYREPEGDFATNCSDAFEDVIVAKEQLSACTRAQRDAEPERRGTLELRWTIALDGSTHDIEVMTPALRGSRFARCMSDVIASIHFPRRLKLREPATFPFTF